MPCSTCNTLFLVMPIQYVKRNAVLFTRRYFKGANKYWKPRWIVLHYILRVDVSDSLQTFQTILILKRNEKYYTENHTEIFVTLKKTLKCQWKIFTKETTVIITLKYVLLLFKDTVNTLKKFKITLKNFQCYSLLLFPGFSALL